ncbi:MAG TPA: hypothetical protein VGA73_06980 [Candidatus Binatia bacterium]
MFASTPSFVANLLFPALAGILALALAGCTTAPAGSRIDNIPMYGQPEIPRPAVLKAADELFIQQAAGGLGSREKAGIAWAMEGEKYMSEGNLDFAMRRYNQSWLLNPNSYRPYWGFGRVLTEQDKFDEAIKHFEKAKQLIDDDYQKTGLLSDLGAAYAFKGESISQSNADERARYFALANENFRESVKLDPKYANAWRQWAMALYREGDYAGAWEKVKEARARNAKSFPPTFLRDLDQKMPPPK